jgi:hypothetical protein
VADVVEIVMALRNVRQFVTGAEASSRAMKGVGNASEKAGKQAGIGWKGVAKWAGGAAAIVGATKFVKGAVSATTDLAKSTMTLQRSTNLDTETASTWAALTKERGIATKQFQVSLVKLSKEMEKARQGNDKQTKSVASLNAEIDRVRDTGGKKAPAAIAKLTSQIEKARASGAKTRKTMNELGISQADLAKGDTASVLAKIADRFAKIENPAKRVALAQQLFGRSGQALVPILQKGAAGVQELLDKQKSYGNYLEGKNIDDTKALIEQQRELKTAMEGVRVQVGLALLPVMVQAGQVIVSVTRFLRPLTKNALLFKILLVALAAAFVVYKVSMLAATVAQTLFNVQLGFTAVVIGIVVIAFVALAIGLVVLYRRSETFRNAVDALWRTVKFAASTIVGALKSAYEWIKTNWPLLVAILTGPFGIATLAIVKHFDQIKAGARAAMNFLIRGWNGLQFRIPGFDPPGPGPKFGGFTLSVPKIPELALGGIVRDAGSVLVGERGPELLTLPRAATVTPLDGAGGLRSIEIVVPVMLNDREIARSTARVTADKLARR